MGETLTHLPIKLPIITRLLDAFHIHSIRYCLLRGNNDLASRVSGDATLDILFDVTQRDEVEQLLESTGYKVFQPVRQKQYQVTTDFLGLDLPSGKFVHIRIHYRMMFGERYLRAYHFCHETLILNSRVFNEDFGVYCIDPSLELILLFVLEALKLRGRDRVMMLFGKSIHFTKTTLHEFVWLKSRATEEQISLYLAQMFKGVPSINPSMMGEIDKKSVCRLAPLLRKELKHQRLYPRVKGNLIGRYREWSLMAPAMISQLMGYPFRAKRTNPRGGLVVAVVGADGSGKSTVTRNMQQTFDSKIDMLHIYFGRGDGKISLVRQLLRAAKQKSQPAKLSKTDKAVSASKSGTLKHLYKCIEAMLVAREKSKNLDRMVAGRKKGMLVICDRFPQNQIHGYNDGPLLSHLLQSANPLLSFIAHQEQRIYARAQQLSPDIMIKLIAEPEIVEARKPGEVSLEKLRAKIEGIKALVPSGRCTQVTIDASRPLAEVLKLVKQEIWQNL